VKVILLAPTPPPSGGIASWAMRMLNCRPKDGWVVDIVDEKVLGGREIFGDRTKINFFIEVKRTLGIWRNLNRKLKDKDVEIVHSNIPANIKSMLRELGCLIITKLNRKKFIIHYRCTISNMIKGKLDLMIFRILTGFSDGVIVLNSPSKKFSEKYSKTPVHLIPNFIESSAITEDRQYSINKEINRAIYVGGVIVEKGCLEILEASKHFPNIEFRLIGKVSYAIKSAVKTNNVVLLGEQTKEVVEKELEDADIFLFPSYFTGEGFSNALVEAMAKGLPCIVSNWAANADMLENKGGFIVPIKNSQAFTDAIKKIQDQELRKEMSVWNVQKVTKCYKEEIITSCYFELYKQICRKG
jgi:glycosyltransferase involved in cell wall biosynthesis